MTLLPAGQENPRVLTYDPTRQTGSTRPGIPASYPGTVGYSGMGIEKRSSRQPIARAAETRALETRALEPLRIHRDFDVAASSRLLNNTPGVLMP